MRFPKLFRCALLLLAGLALQPAGAATITFNDPNCAAFTLSGSGGSYTLSCTSLVCSLTANPPTQLPNQPVALSVSCQTPFTTATWSAAGIGCTPPVPGALGQATATENGVRTCIYTANVSDGSLNGQGNVSVAWANTPPVAPTNCSIARTPLDGNLTTAGGAVSATVTCSGGGAANAWTWRKNGSNFATTQTINDTLPPNTLITPVVYTYEATACNGPSCAPPVSATFTVAGTAPPSMCSQYQNVVSFDLPWGGYVDTHTLNPNFMANGVAVGKFTVPAGFSRSTLGQASGVAFIDGPAYRTFTLSTQACDFRPSTDPTGVNGPLARTVDQNPGLWFSVIGSGFYYVRLTPGQTYYVNVRNYDSMGNLTCGNSTCNMRITLSPPQ